MNKLLKSVKPITVLGGLLGSYFVYKVFSSSRNVGKLIKVKKWVNWKIEFKTNTSEEDKDKALIEVNKYILKYLHKQDYLGLRIRSIKVSYFDVPDINAQGISIGIDLGRTSTTAVSTPIPPPKPPKDELLPQLVSPFIQHITDMQNFENVRPGESF